MAKGTKQKRMQTKRASKPKEATWTLELNLEQMAFLRLLLTQATVGPANMKIVQGQLQSMVEGHIGPISPQGGQDG